MEGSTGRRSQIGQVNVCACIPAINPDIQYTRLLMICGAPNFFGERTNDQNPYNESQKVDTKASFPGFQPFGRSLSVEVLKRTHAWRSGRPTTDPKDRLTENWVF
jgi:hypothetical protein